MAVYKITQNGPVDVTSDWKRPSESHEDVREKRVREIRDYFDRRRKDR